MTQSSDEDASDSLFTNTPADDPSKLIRINFYIANHLPTYLRQWLTTVIEAGDGRVSNKNSDSFPARGYVLVDPSTPDAEKLQRRHDRDNTKASLRHVVDWKFVPACVEEHRIIPWDEIPDGDNVFKRGDENRAWSVFVYPSGHHATLLRYAYQLSRHGAELVDKESAASFIVCDPKARAHARLLEKHVSDMSTFVVTPSWITHCIKSGHVKMSLSRTNVSPPRRRGVPYSAEEDQHLVEYLAEVCPADVPYVSSRLAMTIYKNLVANPTKYPWAKTHPAQSWRERFKKRRDELEPRIETLVAKRSRAGKRKAPSGDSVDRLPDLPVSKRAKLATPNTANNITATSERHRHGSPPADRRSPTSQNLPRALPHGSSMSAPSRCDRDTALVYVYSDDDDPLPFEAAEDASRPPVEPRQPSDSAEPPGDGEVPSTPANKDAAEALPEMPPPENLAPASHDETNSHDHQPTDLDNEEAASPSQTVRESAEETASPEESTSLPVTRVLRSRSISIQPPHRGLPRSKKGRQGPADESAPLPRISEKSPPPSNNELGDGNEQIDQGNQINNHPPDHSENTEDEEEVEITLSQAQPADTTDEGSIILEDGPAATGNVNDAGNESSHQLTQFQPEDDDSPSRPQRVPTPPPPPQLARGLSADNYDSPSTPRRAPASPVPFQHARAISVDYSPAIKIHRGAETQAMMEEREHALRVGRHALASRALHLGEPSSSSDPFFKGKARARIPEDVDAEGVYPVILADIAYREPLFGPSPPLNHRRAPLKAHREGNGMASDQRGEHLLTSPRRSRMNTHINEDSDEHFAGLDSIMARALRVLCKRYRFSAMDVRQKFELRNQDLASTKKVLEENRRILDQDSLFQDFSQ